MSPLRVDLITKLRASRGFATSADLARAAGLSRQLVWRIEARWKYPNGRTPDVSLGTIEKLAQALGVTPHDLIAAAPAKRARPKK